MSAEGGGQTPFANGRCTCSCDVGGKLGKKHGERNILEEFDCVIMVFGMTGSGVSSTVNSLLGWNACRVGSGLHSTTQEIQSEIDKVKRIQVIDMPDLVSIDREYNSDDWKSREVLSRWTRVLPNATLLVIRADERYTEGQYKIYKEMREKLGDLISPESLIIVFTHGNFFEEDVVRRASGELQRVLQDASYRYVELENNASDDDKEINVCRLLTMVDRLRNPLAPERRPAEKIPRWNVFDTYKKTLCVYGACIVIISVIILVVISVEVKKCKI